MKLIRGGRTGRFEALDEKPPCRAAVRLFRKKGDRWEFRATNPPPQCGAEEFGITVRKKRANRLDVVVWVDVWY